MLHRRVLFDTPAPLPAVDPVRMDVAAFLGFLTPNATPKVSDAQFQSWAREGYLSKDEITSGQVDSVLEKPFILTSADQLDAVFSDDVRVDQICQIVGKSVPESVPVETAQPAFSVVIDGDMITEDWPQDISNLADAVIHFQSRLPQLEFALEPTQSGVQLRVSRNLSHGATTLSVLAHAALGFEATLHARARRVGTAMHAAIRHYFANGGKRATVVSVGEALPVFAPEPDRQSALAQLLGIKGYTGGALEPLLNQDLPPAHIESTDRAGITHLFGMEDAAFLLMPDLPELVCQDRQQSISVPDEPDAIAGFAKCTPAPQPLRRNHLADIDLPLCDAQGASLWAASLTRALRLIKASRRDVMVLAGLPQFKHSVVPTCPDSAFLQLAQPWARSVETQDLPAGAMATDAILAAQISRVLNSDVAYASAAAQPIYGLQTVIGRTFPLDQANSVLKGPNGQFLSADYTASTDPAWHQATASRIAARLIRMAQSLGQTIVFDPISDRLMQQIRLSFEQALDQMAEQGALYVTGDDRGYWVTCDRSINTEADRATGRLNCHVSFRPSAPIEWISMSLAVRAA